MESMVLVGHRDGEPQTDRATTVLIDYVNHRGERALRMIVPQRIYFDELKWHPGA